MAPQAQTPEDESLRFNLGRAVLLLENALGRVPGGATSPTDPALSQELQDALDSVRQALRVPEDDSDTDLEDLVAAAASQGLREPARSEDWLEGGEIGGRGGDMDPWRQIAESLDDIHTDLERLRDELSSNLRWTIGTIAGALILLGSMVITGCLLLDGRMGAIEEILRTLAH